MFGGSLHSKAFNGSGGVDQLFSDQYLRYLSTDYLFSNCLATGFSWHGKKKEKPPSWTRDPNLVPASLPTTDGVAEGVSRFSGTDK